MATVGQATRRALVLIGFMGAGKSTVATELAEALGVGVAPGPDLRRAGVVEGSARQGTRVILSEPQAQPAAALRNSVLWDSLGPDNLVPSFDLAVATARGHVGRHSAEITMPEGLRKTLPPA